MIDRGNYVGREEGDHGKLHREHEGDDGDARVLQGEGPDLPNRSRQDGLHQHCLREAREE